MTDKALVAVGILAYEGVDELDLAGLLAPFMKASQHPGASPRICPRLFGPAAEFRGSNGTRMRGDAAYDATGALPNVDVLAIPGGRGALEAAQLPGLRRLVVDARDRKVPIYTVCSGALILAELGLLKNMRVAIHAAKAAELASRGQCLASNGLVRDGWLVSAGGFEPGDGLKGVEVAFAILRDHAPHSASYVASRLEAWPSHRTEVSSQGAPA